MKQQEFSFNNKLRFPIGIFNWVALAIGVILFVAITSSLATQIFFEHRLTLRQPTQYELILKLFSLGFFATLFAIQHLRNPFRLLLIALLCFVLASLFGKIVFFFSGNLMWAGEITFSIMNLISATLFCLALLKGERLDEFVAKVPMLLLSKLLRIEGKSSQKS